MARAGGSAAGDPPAPRRHHRRELARIPTSTPGWPAKLEEARGLRDAHAARERARRAAQQAAAAADERKRPTDEELGHIETDDSFTKIFDDAGAELTKFLRDLREEHRDR